MGASVTEFGEKYQVQRRERIAGVVEYSKSPFGHSKTISNKLHRMANLVGQLMADAGFDVKRCDFDGRVWVMLNFKRHRGIIYLTNSQAEAFMGKAKWQKEALRIFVLQSVTMAQREMEIACFYNDGGAVSDAIEQFREVKDFISTGPNLWEIWADLTEPKTKKETE
jgi:hypothetical protein